MVSTIPPYISSDNFSLPENSTTASQNNGENSNTGLYGPIDHRLWYKHNYERDLYGYVIPAIGLLIIVFNITMIKIFITRKLFSPTNIILGTIAFLDILTIIFPSVIWVYFYGIRRYFYYMPFSACRIWHDLSETLPSVMHSVVIELNLLLSIQRFILVACPYRARKICSHRNTFMTMTILIVVFSTSAVPGFLEFSYFSTPLPSESNLNGTMDGCLVGISTWIGNIGVRKYIGTKLCVRAVVTIFIPWCGVTLFCGLTLRICRHNNKERKKLTQNLCRNFNPEARLTMATVVMGFVFVVAELPSAIIIMLDAVSYMLQITIFPNNLAYTLVVFNNFLIVLSCSFNFLLYLYFCKHFRHAVFETWKCPGSVRRVLSVKSTVYILPGRSSSSQSSHISSATHSSLTGRSSSVSSNCDLVEVNVKP